MMIKKCPTCGSYMTPYIKYQYGIAWTEYYCHWCNQGPIGEQIIYTTTTDDDFVEKKHNFKSRLIKANE